MSNNKKKALWGVVVGTVVGSVTALLFAPKAGKELRKDIADGATSTLEKAQEIAAQASDKGVELYDKAKDVVVEVKEWGKQRLNSDVGETVEISGITVEGTADAADVAVEVADVTADVADVTADAIDATADIDVDVDATIISAGLEDATKSNIE